MRVVFEFDLERETEKWLIENIDRFKAQVARWGPDFINPSGKLQIEMFLGDIDPRVTVETEEDT